MEILRGIVRVKMYSRVKTDDKKQMTLVEENEHSHEKDYRAVGKAQIILKLRPSNGRGTFAQMGT